MKTSLTPIASAVVLALAGTAVHAQTAPAKPAAAASASSSADTQRVEVKGIRASRESSLAAKKNSDDLVEVITAEDVGKMPDKNVADALSRVTGVNISSASGGEGGFDENDRVSIRGTSASLTQTLVNGHTIATGDWFILSQIGGGVGRSVSYSLLPSELVGRITVNKSQRADLVEGGSVGSVNVETRKPLDLAKGLTLEGSVQAVYADLAKKTDPQLSALLGYKSDDGTFAALGQVFSQTRHLRRDGIEYFGGYKPITNTAVTTAQPGLKDVLAPAYIGIAMFEQERKRDGLALEVQSKVNKDLTVGLSALYSKMTASNYNTNFLANVGGLLGAGLAPTSYTVGPGNVLTSAKWAAQDATPYAVVDSIYRPGAGSETTYLNFDGRYKASENLVFTGQVGTTKGIGKSDKEIGLEYLASGAGLEYKLNGLSAPSLSFPSGSGKADTFNQPTFGWVWGPRGLRNTDKEDYGQVDGEYSFPDAGILQSLKFGVRLAKHERDVDWPVASGPLWSAGPDSHWPTWSAGQTTPGNFGSGFGGDYNGVWRLDPAAVEAWADKYANTQAGPDQRGPYYNGMFNIKEKTSAGYLMANLDGGSLWRGNVGVRLVRTDLISSAWSSTNDTKAPGYIQSLVAWPFSGVVPTSVERSYTDVLPSASFRFQAAKDIVVRTALAQTMTRPDFSALNAAAPGVNNLTNSGDGGNPYLDPVRSTNADLTVEYYFAPKSMVSAGLFIQDFRNYAVPGTYKTNLFNETSGKVEEYTITSYTNGKARNSGLELGLQQPLWGNFGMAANYTYADGEQTSASGQTMALTGNSRHTANLEGYYENDTWSVRTAYTYRSSFLTGLDRSDQQHLAASTNLAASVNYKLNDKVTITFDALNLNNPSLKYYYKDETQPSRIYNSGRQFYLGLRAKL